MKRNPPDSTPPETPSPMRLAAHVLRPVASLRLAVILIAACVVVLAWATCVESVYGTPAVQFGVYRTPWFFWLNILLAVNVLSAALIRLPWKRHQTGFVITHAGILVLLVGCFVTFSRGLDAQLSIVEGAVASRAYESSQHLQLEVKPLSGPKVSPADTGMDGGRTRSETMVVEVPLNCGPFNWEDYDNKWFWQRGIASRSEGVLFDQDGIRVEVLDYYSDSRREPVPRIKLLSRSGDEVEILTLDVGDMSNPHGMGGASQMATTKGGHQIFFWMARSPAETEAFLNSQPEGPLGPQGQIVLYAKGQTFRFSVDELAEKSKQPLGDTGLQVELDQTVPQFLGVRLRVSSGQEPPHGMALFAGIPTFNRQDHANEVFGTYWVEVPDEADQFANPRDRIARSAAMPRVDILQGHDERLYYRTFDAGEVGAIGPWPSEGEGPLGAVGMQITAFEKTDAPLKLTLDDFIPRDRPGWMVEPRPFKKKHTMANPQPRLRVRLTVDGKEEEFWLSMTGGGMPNDDSEKTVDGKGRRVKITMVPDEVPLGFLVYLEDFHRKLDPGSGMPSHYSSDVYFQNLEAKQGEAGDAAALKRPEDWTRPDKDFQRQIDGEEPITIGQNRPIDYRDPLNGRSYRLFQSSFRGPWKPGDAEYEQMVDDPAKRDQLFISTLSVNYDPGRGLKYAGSLLIVVGIAVMYYMRAYFFKRKTKPRTKVA